MARILIRSGKLSVQPLHPIRALTDDYIGANTGNLMFFHSVQRHLSVEGTELIPTTCATKGFATSAEYINHNYDAFILPLANAFRPAFVHHLDAYSELIEKLEIPVVVTSVGAQAEGNDSFESLAGVNESAKRLMRAVLDRSSSVSVRGAFTADYLKTLGFGDEHVRIVGCPSLFMHGPNFQIRDKRGSLGPDAKLTVHLNQEISRACAIALSAFHEFDDFMYIAQDKRTLEAMVCGHSYGGPFDLYGTQHPFFTANKACMFVDAHTWIRYLSERDFTFGTRIHGTIASLLAGTPGLLLAHDSRTKELAETLSIPHVDMDEVSATTHVEELYERCDVEATKRNYKDAFDRYVSFLDENSLAHIFDGKSQPNDFDSLLRSRAFPPAVTLEISEGQEAERYMIREAFRKSRAAEGSVKALRAVSDRASAQSHSLMKELIKRVRRLEDRTILGWVRESIRKR